MIRVAILTGSTRPTRKAKAVAEWVCGVANQRGDAEYVLVDIAEFNLPLLDEPMPPRMARYQNEHTKTWAAEIAGYDAFVFVTPEYNHSVSAALKNAIDYLFQEWHHKVAGFVSYGADKGVRAVEHLRQILGELAVADVRAKVALSLRNDFENFSAFKPRDYHVPLLNAMLDEVVMWGEALKLVRGNHRFNLMGQPIEKVQSVSHDGPRSSQQLADAAQSATEIADRWIAALAAADVDALVNLYHPEVILETPATYVLSSPFHGVMQGLEEVRQFFDAVVHQTPLPRPSRRPPPLTNGRVFTWESNISFGNTNAREFAEVMEIRDGLIFRHRFYWGWRSFLGLFRNEGP